MDNCAKRVSNWGYTIYKNEDNKTDKILKKLIPIERKFNIKYDKRELHKIEVDPPTVQKDDNLQLRRLIKENTHIDCLHHNNNSIIESFYS